MLHSYQKMYLSKAQAVLGETFDYAINTCKIPGESFIKQFVVSSASKRMENGEPAYLVGKSGIEIAADIVAETTGKELTEKPTDRFERSIEYWIGWTIAYYQWWSGRKYSTIFRVFAFDELQKMYYTLHEADVSKFADIADERMRKLFPETSLKRIRQFMVVLKRNLQKSRVSASDPYKCTSNETKTSTKLMPMFYTAFQKCLDARWKT